MKGIWELLFAFLTATILGWSFSVSIALSIGLESLSAKRLISLSSGMFRFLTALGNERFKSSPFFSHSKVAVSLYDSA